MRPLQDVNSCSSSGKMKNLTGGVHEICRGLNFASDAEIGQNGTFCKGLTMVYPKIILLLSLMVLAAAIPAAESEELYRLPTTVSISKLELADLSINEFEPITERQAAVFSLKLNPRNLLQFTAKMSLLRPELNSDPDSVLLPQMFIAVGDDLYAGLGTRYLIEDGNLIDDPQFSLRAGVDLEILPYIFLDISADYRFDDWSELKEDDAFSTEDFVWGGALRIQF